MKILVAVVSPSGKPADGALRLPGRAGYDFRLFVPKNKRRQAREAIEDANYHWYLPTGKEVVYSKLPPLTYALKQGYDLLVTIPDNLEYWITDLDNEVADFCTKIGSARLKFSQQPRKRIERLKKGVTMERVI